MPKQLNYNATSIAIGFISCSVEPYQKLEETVVMALKFCQSRPSSKFVITFHMYRLKVFLMVIILVMLSSRGPAWRVKT